MDCLLGYIYLPDGNLLMDENLLPYATYNACTHCVDDQAGYNLCL